MTKYVATLITQDETVYVIKSDSRFPKYVNINVFTNDEIECEVKLDRSYLSQLLRMIEEADHT